MIEVKSLHHDPTVEPRWRLVADAVEFFLDPGCQQKRFEYYHVIVTPDGFVYHGKGLNPGGWQDEVAAKVGKVAAGWAVEAAVPFVELGLKEGAIPKVWGLNICRQRPELCPAELPVAGALRIVEPINRLLELPWARIDTSQDWHPPDHRSFFGRLDNLYPSHCVAGTRGAEFLPGLYTDRFHTVWRKGYQPDFEAYAATAQHPALGSFLKASGLTGIVICGLATNICCFFTARDLRQLGFTVWIVEDASAGIDVPAAGLFQDQARAEGERLGIRYVGVNDLITRLL